MDFWPAWRSCVPCAYECARAGLGGEETAQTCVIVLLNCKKLLTHLLRHLITTVEKTQGR